MVAPRMTPEIKLLLAILGDQREPRPSTDVAAFAVNLAEQTRKVLATLSPLEKKVLRMRFGIGEEPDGDGQSFEVTRERIRLIEAKALAALNEARGSRKRRARR